MDVINISGLQFRMKPDITIGHILEVFRGFGREGVIQRNGVVELLDSKVDFNTLSPYKFIDAADMLASDIYNCRSGAQYLPDSLKYGKTADILIKKPIYVDSRVGDIKPTVFNRSTAFFNEPILLNEPTTLSKENELINGELINGELINDELINGELINRELINRELINRELINRELINRELDHLKSINSELINGSVDILDKQNVFLNQPTSLLNRPTSLLSMPTALLDRPAQVLNQEVQSLYDRRIVLGNRPIEFLSPREQTMIYEKQGFLNSKSLPISLTKSAYLEPKFYQFVVIKAQEDRYLNLDQIEVYNINGDNIAYKARFLSSGMLLGEDGLKRSDIVRMIQARDQRNYLPTSLPGGWIRLKFEEQRKDSISKIILRNRQNDISLNEFLNGAKLEVRKVNEYTIAKDCSTFQCMNSYPNDLINAIEIRAPEDRLLRLVKIQLLDNQQETVGDVLSFDSSVLVGTRNDLTAKELLLDSRIMDGDYIQSVNCGGYVRLMLTKPTPIKYVRLFGFLRGVKVTMERTHSYICSNDMVQHFSI